MNCLTELLVFPVSLYTTFFCRQFPSWGHVSLSLQLHCLLGCVLLWKVSIFIVAFYDLKYVTCTTVADLYIVFVENLS